MILFTVACKNEKMAALSMIFASLHSCYHGPLCLAKSITSSLERKFVMRVFKTQKEEWKVSSGVKYCFLFKFAIQILGNVTVTHTHTITCLLELFLLSTLLYRSPTLNFTDSQDKARIQRNSKAGENLYKAMPFSVCRYLGTLADDL